MKKKKTSVRFPSIVYLLGQGICSIPNHHFRHITRTATLSVCAGFHTQIKYNILFAGLRGKKSYLCETFRCAGVHISDFGRTHATIFTVPRNYVTTVLYRHSKFFGEKLEEKKTKRENHAEIKIK